LLTHREAPHYSLGLAKKDTSRTHAQVSASTQQLNREYVFNGVSGESQVGTAGVGVSLSQSMWKNFFGEGTRLRLQREKIQSQSESGAYNLQLQLLLVQAEAAYWDLIYQRQEVVLRTQNLERAGRIENWVRRRVTNGIGDRADTLNAQGLSGTRELQLLSAKDLLRTAELKVADFLETPVNELPPLNADLDQVRSLDVVGGPQGRVVRLESYLAALEARVKSLNAEEVEENLKPDLTFTGSYQTSNTDGDAASAFSRASDPKTPVSQAALTLTWLLDGDLKRASRQVARQEALAATLKKDRSLLESESAWMDLRRRHQELTKKIELAAKINQIQSQKAAAERDKLSKGRSITSEVITAEQDAAEAELNLSRLKAEQRKLEAEGRLFVKASEL
jgi:outer membrane protein TolC